MALTVMYSYEFDNAYWHLFTLTEWTTVIERQKFEREIMITFLEKM